MDLYRRGNESLPRFEVLSDLVAQKRCRNQFRYGQFNQWPFSIGVSGDLISGGNNLNGNRPELLGARVYKVIDHNGNIVPNEYVV